ncbi:MAG: LysR family transcriptional regulator [Silicimonas sp.]|jgi:DNA-binding transcriptional LysR family regulator|nr:LysR family transcriptional regulator [Silicimonas sp.]
MNAPSLPTIPLLDLDLLKTLVAIADTGNFSAAAAAVFRTPSAVSMQVKKMEELLGRPVFIRDSRSVELTPDGAFLLEHARRMLALNREAVARFVQPDVEGVVRMGAPDDCAERFLPTMLRRFAGSHPCVTVNVTVDGTHRMIEMLRAGKLDMTLVTAEVGFEDRGTEVLYREQLVWAMRRGGMAASQEPLPVSVWEEGCVWRKAGLDGLNATGRKWRIAFQSAHISGQRAAILADLAVAPIPVSSLGGEIIEAPAKFGLPKLPKYALGLLMADDPNPAVLAAADHLRASFAGAV